MHVSPSVRRGDRNVQDSEPCVLDDGPMPVDVSAARSFMAAHARQLDRRRLELVLGGDGGGVVAALDAYRNPDGGYGWGLEPDLRSTTSQPAAAMHALGVIAEMAPERHPSTVALCDWLAARSLPNGGLPMALPLDDPAGCAPWWTGADTTSSSLQMTAQVAARAHRVARHDPPVAGHPWLAAATSWTVDAIGSLDTEPHAYELLFALQFLDAAADAVPEADALLDGLARFVPADGVLPVQGGVDGEALHLLDIAPDDGPVRRLFTADAVAADLDRLVERQQPDGGWTVDFPSSSPAGALEWRGDATVGALSVLRRNARL